MPLYMAIVHYPCVNKQGHVVTTSITNFDIHDMGRTARTYEVDAVYMVNPVDSQLWFANRVIKHWTEGSGGDYNHTRKESMGRLALCEDLCALDKELKEKHGADPIYVGTSARRFPNSISFVEGKEMIAKEERPVVLVFGTGWGLHPDLVEEFDYLLEPIDGPGKYNHLSVRSAAAIILDRLRGR